VAKQNVQDVSVYVCKLNEKQIHVLLFRGSHFLAPGGSASRTQQHGKRWKTYTREWLQEELGLGLLDVETTSLLHVRGNRAAVIVVVTRDKIENKCAHKCTGVHLEFIPLEDLTNPLRRISATVAEDNDALQTFLTPWSATLSHGGGGCSRC